VIGKFAKHNTLITQNNKVYVWGANYYGQLGLINTTKIYTPTENTYLEQIIQQNGGVENISMITFGYIIFNNNKVYRWGTYEIYKPTEAPQLEELISQKGIKGIWINSGYLFILTNTNELYRYTMHYDYSIHAPREYIEQVAVLPGTIKLPKIIDSTTTTTINFVL